MYLIASTDSNFFPSVGSYESNKIDKSFSVSCRSFGERETHLKKELGQDKFAIWGNGIFRHIFKIGQLSFDNWVTEEKGKLRQCAEAV